MASRMMFGGAVLVLLFLGVTVEARSTASQDLIAKANQHAYAAFTAYCTQMELARVPGIVGVATNAQYGTQAFVIRPNNERIYVVFRGSVNMQNWMSNADYVQTSLTWSGVPSGVKVHRGFLLSYTSLRTNVLAYLRKAEAACPQCEVHVTGHSLGGAQATLAGTDLRLQGRSNVYLFTYGAPRVGNRAFASFANSISPEGTSYRVVNKLDNIPHVLPTLNGFFHSGREVWITSAGTYLCDIGEDSSCSKSVQYISTIIDHMTYASLGCSINVMKAY